MTPLQYLQIQVRKRFQIVYFQYHQIINKNAKGFIHNIVLNVQLIGLFILQIQRYQIVGSYLMLSLINLTISWRPNWTANINAVFPLLAIAFRSILRSEGLKTILTTPLLSNLRLFSIFTQKSVY